MADVVEQPTDTLYEADEHAWIERQIEVLRDGDLARLDRANLIAYLTDMAARDRRELGSRLVVLYAHVLNWRIQPENATESWRLTIREQQRAVRRLLKSLPSLERRADDVLREIYPDAVERAFDEMKRPTGLDPAAWSEPDLDVAGLLGFDASK
ncbi:MAG TPA: DUF29 domain-containing protein [Rhodopila sp.]|jgi:hypothetical protein